MIEPPTAVAPALPPNATMSPAFHWSERDLLSPGKYLPPVGVSLPKMPKGLSDHLPLPATSSIWIVVVAERLTLCWSFSQPEGAGG